jgi:hypothetical protein
MLSFSITSFRVFLKFLLGALGFFSLPFNRQLSHTGAILFGIQIAAGGFYRGFT